MYFNNKGNTNIDNEFNEKKFKLFGFNFSSKNRVTYYLGLNGE